MSHLRVSYHLLLLLAESKRTLEIYETLVFIRWSQTVLKHAFHQSSNHEFELTVKLEK